LVEIKSIGGHAEILMIREKIKHIADLELEIEFLIEVEGSNSEHG